VTPYLKPVLFSDNIERRPIADRLELEGDYRDAVQAFLLGGHDLRIREHVDGRRFCVQARLPQDLGGEARAYGDSLDHALNYAAQIYADAKGIAK